MNDQVTPEGEALPSDANASQVTPPTDVETEQPGSEADSSPAATDSSEPAKPKKSGEDRRIDELTRRWREEQRRSDRLMAMLEDRKRDTVPAPRATDEPATTQPSQPLSEEDRILAAAERLVKKQEESARKSSFKAKESSFAKSVDDYADVVHSGLWDCSPAMAEVIEESDEGPAVAYYLASNPDLAEKLSKLSDAKAGKELARIEDRILADRKKPVSKAPAPPPKIEAVAPAATSVKASDADSDKLSTEEWMRLREKQVKRKK